MTTRRYRLRDDALDRVRTLESAAEARLARAEARVERTWDDPVLRREALAQLDDARAELSRTVMHRHTVETMASNANRYVLWVDRITWGFLDTMRH